MAKRYFGFGFWQKPNAFLVLIVKNRRILAPMLSEIFDTQQKSIIYIKFVTTKWPEFDQEEKPSNK